MVIDNLVSIIMPAFNAQNFIQESIQSVINQTYANWELLIVDDYSTDRTVQAVQFFQDRRIRFFQLKQNSGAAVARNVAIKQARGEFMAFLDADDLWTKDKLEEQIDFMKVNNYSFTSTKYGQMNESSEIISIVDNFPVLDYEGVLKHCPGNSTVMYDVKKLGKFYVPDIKRRNDFVMWLQVIKKAGLLHGLNQTNTIYRVGQESLSNDKKKLVKYQWTVYRDIEKLGLGKSAFLLAHKILSVLLKSNQTKVN